MEVQLYAQGIQSKKKELYELKKYQLFDAKCLKEQKNVFGK